MNIRICGSCKQPKECLPLDRKLKDPNRHSMNRAGKTWFRDMCPECALEYQYTTYRKWAEKKARLERRPVPQAWKLTKSGFKGRVS